MTASSTAQLPDNLRAKIQVRRLNRPGVSGACWIWTGADNGLGYGRALIARRWWYVHRFTYTLLVGEIPDGLVLDHRCRVPACVRPTHLEPVTHGENMARGLKGWRKSKCNYGHELVGHNRMERKRGRWIVWECRTCANNHATRRRHARRANRQAVAA